MDTSMISWAFHWGGIAAAPACLVVGTVYAAGTTFSPIHYTVAKTLGWVGGMPVSLFVGYAVHDAFVPSFGDKFGGVYCFGFGWIATWTIVQTLGVEDGPFVRVCGAIIDRLKGLGKSSARPQDGFGLKGKGRRK